MQNQNAFASAENCHSQGDMDIHVVVLKRGDKIRGGIARSSIPDTIPKSCIRIYKRDQDQLFQSVFFFNVFIKFNGWSLGGIYLVASSFNT